MDLSNPPVSPQVDAPRRTRPGGLLDLVYKILILVFCLVLIGVLIRALFSEGELLGIAFRVALSSGGLALAFYLYMKWRVLEIVLQKLSAEPETITPELVDHALRLIPGRSGGQHAPD